MREMPKPTEQHRKLHALAGEWEGAETLAPSPWGPGGPAMGSMKYRVDLEGFFVVGDYVEEKDGQVVFRGHSVFGWDEKQKNYVWWWLDSMGSIPAAPSRGKWEGNTLIFESKSEMGESRYTFQFLGEEKYSMRLANRFPGQSDFTTFMEGTYARKAPAPRS